MPDKKISQATHHPHPHPALGILPDWYGWLAVVAMALLSLTRIDTGGDVFELPLLSLGEWLLLPLGLASLTMGLLAMPRLRERTLLPLWLAAIVPGVLWLLAQGLAVAKHGASSETGDLILTWVVRLLFPALTFMPLLADRVWRDRLMWALVGGLFLNVIAVIVQSAVLRLDPGDAAQLGVGGLLANQHDYGLLTAMGLPLAAAWRGGEIQNRKSLAMVACMFLLPSLALATCSSWVGVFASLAGLVVSWVAWRSQAWILGVFLILLVFGYGAAGREERDFEHRRVLVQSVQTAGRQNRAALRAFINRPFLGYGPDSTRLESRNMEERQVPARPWPWYAMMLGGSGLVGLGMWLVLLGEIAARALGRDGRRSQLRGGGVLGAVVGLAVAGVWTDALPAGAGALVGFLLALSMVEDPLLAEGGKRFNRAHDKKRLSHRAKSPTPPEREPAPRSPAPDRPA